MTLHDTHIVLLMKAGAIHCLFRYEMYGAITLIVMMWTGVKMGRTQFKSAEVVVTCDTLIGR